MPAPKKTPTSSLIKKRIEIFTASIRKNFNKDTGSEK
jgi:hypothetical protein